MSHPYEDTRDTPLWLALPFSGRPDRARVDQDLTFTKLVPM